MRSFQVKTPRKIDEAPLVPVDAPVPGLGEDELLVRVLTCGVCHTDLHVVEGDLPPRRLPITPGHQIVGVVEKTGHHVAGHRVGDRVGIGWLHSTDGACDYCIAGNENLCTHAKFTGYDVDGGYAEYMTVPATFAYSLPKRWTDAHAAPLLCAGIIGYRALRLSNIQPGGRLGLYGFGASAHIVIQVARHWGCEVSVFSRSGSHRKLAEELGAVWTGTSDQRPPQLLDGAISFAPVGEIVPAALRVLRRGGTLAIAGIYSSPIPTLDYSLLYHERAVRTVANSTRSDAVDFLRLAAEIPVETRVECFPLEEVNRALQLLKHGRIEGAGVLIVNEQ